MQTKTLEDKHKKLNTRYLQNLLHILPIQLLKINQYQIKKKKILFQHKIQRELPKTPNEAAVSYSININWTDNLHAPRSYSQHHSILVKLSKYTVIEDEQMFICIDLPCVWDEEVHNETVARVGQSQELVLLILTHMQVF